MHNKLMIPIDQGWIKNYVDTMLNLVEKLDENSPMRAAVLLRVDHVMDLVKSWHEHNSEIK